MATLDVAILLAWLTLTLGAGIFAGLRSNASRFWVNDRSTGFWPLVMTIVATQVGAGAIIGIAAATAGSGTGFGLVSLASTFGGFVLVGLLAPKMKAFGDRCRAVTLPDLLLHRYGRPVQIVGAIVVVFSYVSLLAGQFQASSTLLKVITGISMESAVVFATVGVVCYSAFAGLRGDIVTDTLHFFAMVVVLLFLAWPLLYGFQGPSIFGAGMPAEVLSAIRFGGWPFLVLGLLFGAVVPLLAPEMWMRAFASRNVSDARRVFFAAAIACVPFYLFAISLGFATYAAKPDGATNEAKVVSTLFSVLPRGALGLGVACVMSVILSTANTLVVVVGATVLRDFMGSDLNDNRNLKLSRVISFLAGLVGAGLALWSGSLVQLLLNTFYALLTLGPAVVAAMFWSRASAVAAFWSILAGFVATIISLRPLGSQAFLPGFLVSTLLMIIISLVAKPPKTDGAREPI